MKNTISILFVVPPLFVPKNFAFLDWMYKKCARFMPLGCLSLAGYAREILPDNTYKILDLNVEIPFRVRNNNKLTGDEAFFSSIIDVLSEGKPDVVCISNLFHSTFLASIAITSLIKEISSNIKIIIGGNCPSVSPEIFIKTGTVDYIVEGEGEYRLVDVLNSITGNMNDKQFEGVYFINNGSIVHYPKDTNRLVNLENLPPLPFDMINYKEYTGLSKTRDDSYLYTNTTQTHLDLFATRGCVNNCSYCASGKANFYGSFRSKSIEQLIREIDYYIEKYKVLESQKFST